jgi:hypothetical protein
MWLAATELAYLESAEWIAEHHSLQSAPGLVYQVASVKRGVQCNTA